MFSCSRLFTSNIFNSFCFVCSYSNCFCWRYARMYILTSLSKLSWDKVSVSSSFEHSASKSNTALWQVGLTSFFEVYKTTRYSKRAHIQQWTEICCKAGNTHFAALKKWSFNTNYLHTCVFYVQHDTV